MSEFINAKETLGTLTTNGDFMNKTVVLLLIFAVLLRNTAKKMKNSKRGM